MSENKKYYAGIDIGSVSTDVVIIDEQGTMISHEIVPTGASFSKAADKGTEAALKKANLSLKNLAGVVSTGYGRKSVDFSNKSITEIRCHAVGAYHIYPEVRTLIDIGGQDCKVILLTDDGGVENFVMNDKCSAGTGRFVDVIARALDVPLNEMGALSLKSTGNCRISSICTVFAESEVISKLSDDISREDIIKGIHVSIGEKILNLVRRVGIKQRIGITGGGGKNIGIVRVIEELLDTKILTYDNPQIIGALGAALEARLLHKEKTEACLV
jgi:predicted CoA-substrate-specific enzyme activase